jgi:TonB family protein
MRRKISSTNWLAFFLLAILSTLSAQTQPPSDSEKATDPSAILKIGPGVTPPRALDQPDPEYSKEARHAGLTGTCILTMVVERQGLPSDITVEKALGMGLDEEAIKAVRQWRFSPAMKNGVPVAVLVNVQVEFHLYGNPPASKYHKLFVKADAGDAKSQYDLAQLFLSDRANMKDETRGLAYLEKSAKLRFPQSSVRNGRVRFVSRK